MFEFNIYFPNTNVSGFYKKRVSGICTQTTVQ